MYYLLSLFTGILISVMIAFNGGLTEQYGVYSAAVIIHIVGLILISVSAIIKRDKPFVALLAKHPWYLFLGGAIGVFTTLAINFAFTRISVSAILALGLLGQSVSGLVVDQYGLLGMPKYRFSKGKLIGLVLIVGGILPMITDFAIAAVIMSFAAGVSIVASRTFNARLFQVTNIRISSFYNYFVGLTVCIPVFLILGREEAFFVGADFTPLMQNQWIYFGGAVGLLVVLLTNVTVVKVSAFYLTLLVFIGQIFSGILIDVIITGQLHPGNLIGGTFVSVGLIFNLYLDYRKSRGGA